MERLKNVAVVVGLILSGITLYNWGSQFFSHDVVARLEPGAFAIPPQLESFYNKLASDLRNDSFAKRVLSDPSFKSAYFLKDLSEDQKDSIVQRVASLLPNDTSITIPYDFRGLEAYWSGNVTNSSKTTVTNVQLYIRSAKFVLVKRDDNSTAPQSVENLITIGDLRPAETVQLSIWCRLGFSYWSNDDVRLTHSSGVGKVVIPRTVTGLAALIDKYDFVVYMMLVLLFAFVVMPLSIERLWEFRLRRRRSNEAAHRTAPRSDVQS